MAYPRSTDGRNAIDRLAGERFGEAIRSRATPVKCATRPPQLPAPPSVFCADSRLGGQFDGLAESDPRLDQLDVDIETAASRSR